MDDNSGQRAPMIDRARSVAAGFADVGLTQAEELLRRLSPEGREQARREREARARRQKRLMVRLVLAAIVSLLGGAALAAVLPAMLALAVAAAMLLLLVIMIVAQADPRAPGREALVETGLAGLAEQAGIWLAAQRRGMPLPALRLADALGSRFEALAPRLARLDPRSPAAASIRKLVAVELPALVDSWRMVGISARREMQADGRTPDDHLINGLRLIDAELARAGECLGRSSLDEIAIQGRYLELKYDGEGPGL